MNERLADDAYLDASDIEVRVAAGEVTLLGRVDGRAARRRAEDVTQDIPGVRHVQNDLRIAGLGAQAAPVPPRGIV